MIDDERKIFNELYRRNLHMLVETIATKYHLTVEEVLSKRRYKLPSQARHEIWAIMHRDYSFSYPMIAKIFDKDHTTIMFGVRKHWERTGKDVLGIEKIEYQ